MPPAPLSWLGCAATGGDEAGRPCHRKLAKLLEGHGLRVQWSVFECELRDDQLQRLRLRLSRLIVSEQDSVRFWPVPQRSCAQTLHLGRTLPSPEWEDRVN